MARLPIESWTEERLDYVRSLDPLHGVPDGERARLPEVHVGAGEQVEMDPDTLFVIRSGAVRLSRSAGAWTVVLGPDDVFGTLPVVGSLGPGSDAHAVTASVLTRLGTSQMLGLFERHPENAVRLLGIVARRLVSTEQRITDLVFRTADQRVARVLAEMAATTQVLEMSHEEIARLAGVARETATKALRRLERRGLVETGYRSVRIVEPDAVMRRAGGWPP